MCFVGEASEGFQRDEFLSMGDGDGGGWESVLRDCVSYDFKGLRKNAILPLVGRRWKVRGSFGSGCQG